MGDRQAQPQRRLTWHTTAGLLAALVPIELGAMIVPVIEGRSGLALLLSTVAVCTSFLARWAEWRHKNVLAVELLRLTDEAVAIMRRIAEDKGMPEDEATELLREHNARIEQFKADNGLPSR